MYLLSALEYVEYMIKLRSSQHNQAKIQLSENKTITCFNLNILLRDCTIELFDYIHQLGCDKIENVAGYMPYKEILAYELMCRGVYI